VFGIEFPIAMVVGLDGAAMMRDDAIELRLRISERRERDTIRSK